MPSRMACCGLLRVAMEVSLPLAVSVALVVGPRLVEVHVAELFAAAVAVALRVQPRGAREPRRAKGRRGPKLPNWAA